YTPGELVPTTAMQTVVSNLPAEKDHDAKAFAFDDVGRMLVEIGSPYNVYSNPDRQLGAKGMDATEFQKTYGGFWRFDPNTLNQTCTASRRRTSTMLLRPRIWLLSSALLPASATRCFEPLLRSTPIW